MGDSDNPYMTRWESADGTVDWDSKLDSGAELSRVVLDLDLGPKFDPVEWMQWTDMANQGLDSGDYSYGNHGYRPDWELNSSNSGSESESFSDSEEEGTMKEEDPELFARLISRKRSRKEFDAPAALALSDAGTDSQREYLENFAGGFFTSSKRGYMNVPSELFFRNEVSLDIFSFPGVNAHCPFVLPTSAVTSDQLDPEHVWEDVLMERSSGGAKLKYDPELFRALWLQVCIARPGRSAFALLFMLELMVSGYRRGHKRVMGIPLFPKETYGDSSKMPYVSFQWLADALRVFYGISNLSRLPTKKYAGVPPIQRNPQPRYPPRGDMLGNVLDMLELYAVSCEIHGTSTFMGSDEERMQVVDLCMAMRIDCKMLNHVLLPEYLWRLEVYSEAIMLSCAKVNIQDGKLSLVASHSRGMLSYLPVSEMEWAWFFSKLPSSHSLCTIYRFNFGIAALENILAQAIGSQQDALEKRVVQAFRIFHSFVSIHTLQPHSSVDPASMILASILPIQILPEEAVTLASKSAAKITGAPGRGAGGVFRVLLEALRANAHWRPHAK